MKQTKWVRIVAGGGRAQITFACSFLIISKQNKQLKMDHDS